MSESQKLLAVDSAGALQFFHKSLKDTIGNERVATRQIMYVAGVLAHFSQTSCSSSLHEPTPEDLSILIDNFLFGGEGLYGSDLYESAGSQILLFAGFFRNQIARRYNLNWLDVLGQRFYARAGRMSSRKDRKDFLHEFSMAFPYWTRACSAMNKRFVQNQYSSRSGLL